MKVKANLLIFLFLFSLTSFSCSNKEQIDDIKKENFVSINTSSGGSILNLSSDADKVNDLIRLKINPLNGYYLSSLSLSDGRDINYESSTIYSFYLASGENVINAEFKEKTEDKDCSLIYRHNEGGDIKLITTSYLTNHDFNFELLPETNYAVESVLINNKTYEINDNNQYNFVLQDNLNLIDIKFKAVEKPQSNYEIVNELKIVKTVTDISINENDDPYKNVDHNQFYKNYEIAKTYEESYFRSKHFLLSGDNSDQSHLTEVSSSLPEGKDKLKDNNGTFLMNALCRYEVDQFGNYISYTVNTLDNNDYKIFYGGAYTSLDDVSAYIFAFGYPPKNYFSKKSITNQELALWDNYARVNISYFSGDTTKYPYEPLLEGILDKYNYYETDFGSIGDYYVGSRYEPLYNDGTRIKRGACRFVFNYSNKDGSTLNLNDRHLYYTYNHYNDFEEYLNYKGGYNERFGNESVGNEANKYDKNNPPSNPPSYSKAIFL